MASRRLDISSLLCDNNPPSFSPLDVLVQAATEERKKIVVDDHQQQQQPPPPHHHQQQQHPQQQQQQTHHYDHRISSPISPRLARHNPYDEPQHHPHHHQRQLSQQLIQSQHQDPTIQDRQQRLPHLQDIHFIENERRRQQQQYELEYRESRHHVQPRPRDMDLYRQQQQQAEQELRAQELKRRQIEEDQHRLREEEQQRILYQQERERKREELVRIERQKEYERRQFEEERRREVERIRDLEYQRQLEVERRRKEDEMEQERRREMDRRERELEGERERERERQRREAEISRVEEESGSDVRRRHRLQDLLDNDNYPPNLATSQQHAPSIQRLVSPPQHLTLTPTINLSQPPTLISSDPIPDARPVKKPRYSQSPIQDNKEPRQQRLDSPIAGPSSAPHRPGSGHGQTRKVVAVSDLLSDKEHTPASRPESRDRDPHRIVSPLGRRSPPGSQIGRAKAARKSDEHAVKEPVNPPPPPPPPPPPIVPREIKLEIESSKPVFKSEDLIKVKEEPKPRHRVITQDFKPQHLHDDGRSKKSIKPSPPAPAPPPPPPPPSQTARQVQPKLQTQPEPKRQQDDDPHAWFLSQFEEEPSPTTSARPDPPRSPTSSVSPVSSALPARPTPIKAKSPPVAHQSLTPITAAVALEQELEALMSGPTVISKPPPSKVKKQEIADVDMDSEIDAAVSELVGTLEADDPPQVKHVGMEVDVEDELLSLVDERPPPPASTLTPSNVPRKPQSSSSTVSRKSVTPSAVPIGNVPGVTAKQQQSPPLRSADGQTSPPSSLLVPPPVISSTGPSVIARPPPRSTSDRDSMPPPIIAPSTSISAGSSKKGGSGSERGGSDVPQSTASSSGGSKKKTASKTPTEPKASTSSSAASAPKPRAKPTAKGKKAAGAATSSAAATVAKSTSTTPTTATPAPGAGTAKSGKAQSNKKATQNHAGSRSRSTSVMPGVETDAVKPEKQEEEEDSDVANDQDKLYCVCKTKYDEDRFMIACDKCDEWYHTQCVYMPELEVDLVDQFICPPCIEKHPHLNLKTTYKQRCLNGLRHPDPSSSRACHKAARGAFSKYCSDDCGVKYMQSLIDNWSKKGNKTDKLLESVKHAEKREGVVHCVVDPDVSAKGMMDVDMQQEQDEKDNKPVSSLKKQQIVLPNQTKVEREVERLNGLLEDVVRFKEEIQKGMEVVLWREQLLALASKRSISKDLCGWDQRLCLDDEEWVELGSSVFETYDSKKAEDGDVEMDGSEEQWWCPEDSSCSRHSGWRDVRFKDISKEKDKKQNALSKLSAREVELRTRIQHLQDPDSEAKKEESVHEPVQSAPLKSTNHKLVNGNSKAKVGTTADTQKKNRKRKAPA